jgi:hypothetical protein
MFKVESLSIGKHVDAGRYAGSILNRCVLVGGKWVAMVCSNKTAMIDLHHFEKLTTHDHQKWFRNVSGYIMNSGNEYMHQMIIGRSVDPNLSIDHINWIKMDNREENLRHATQAQQNNNRATRSDKTPPQAAILAYGIKSLPRGIRYDPTMERYTCADHELCRSVRNNGTRRSDASEIARFKDCLEIYIDNLSSNASYAREASLAADRIRLAKEYKEIAAAAHAFDPAIPEAADVDLEDLEDDLTYARSCLRRIQDVVVVRGPPNIESYETQVLGGKAIARIKGETLTLYDAMFHADLADKNWDVGGGAPRWNKKNLNAYVWALAGKPAPGDGEIVAPISRMAFDVRLENLCILKGRQAMRVVENDHVIPEGISLPWKYLPKGITVNKVGVMCNGAKKSISAKNTIPSIQAGIDWFVDEARKAQGAVKFERENELYQGLLGEYMDVCAKELAD